MAMAYGVSASEAIRIINLSSGFSAASNGIFPDRVLTRKFPKHFELGLMAKDIKVAVDAATEKDLKMPVLQGNPARFLAQLIVWGCLKLYLGCGKTQRRKLEPK